MPCTDVAMHSPALFGRDTGEGETLRVARAIDKDTRTRWPAIHVIQFGGHCDRNSLLYVRRNKFKIARHEETRAAVVINLWEDEAASPDN